MVLDDAEKERGGYRKQILPFRSTGVANILARHGRVQEVKTTWSDAAKRVFNIPKIMSKKKVSFENLRSRNTKSRLFSVIPNLGQPSFEFVSDFRRQPQFSCFVP